jgi:hypothetical protein
VRTSTATDSQSGSDTDNTNNNNGPTTTPTDVPSNNQFEINNSLNLIGQFPTDTNLTYYLRGQQVDQFLKTISIDTQCMVIEFPESVANRFLVLAMIPRNRFLNNSFDQLEKNYSFFPNGTQNQIFCQKSSIISALNSRIPGATIAYKAADVCPNCVTSLFQASKVEMFSINGVQLTDISLSLNSIRIENKIGPDPVGSQCTSKAECQTEGFDCCTIEGICADDLTVKNGIDQQSSEFQEVLRIVNAVPSRKKDFPQYFNICPTDLPVDTELDDGETASDNLESDAKRLVHLADLYDCTREIEGEMSYCTKEIDNVSTLGVTTFETGDDDRNFETTYSGTETLLKHSIVEVTYSGDTLYKDGQFFSSDIKIGSNNNQLGNDNLSDPGIIEMTKTKNANDSDDLLRIKYKIDGSCEPVLGGLAQCTKYYIQGENEGKVTDHFPASNSFVLPQYADSNRTIQIFVDQIPRFNGTHWTITRTNPTTIQFNGSTLQVFEGQEVVIKYFVDTTSNRVLQAKMDALNEIKNICTCSDTKCRLEPIMTERNGKNVVTDFGCFYPQPDLPPAPLQQSILLSSKTVPVRLFDENGEEQTEANFNNLPQEGIEFKYTDRDVLKPNNVDNYIGFNEIYGSITPDNLSAKPAKQVRVDKGKVYDIFVENGTFSSCFNCGTDYFSNVARLFPQNFTTVGGGIFPRPGITERKNSTGYRSDEVIFGRACWIPATMLPWSHRPDSNRQNQRLDRMQAQHFLFSNGYQRDWYGFDYGSIIGSFDGVTWFSVGNQRRIQAKTAKLYLAVNAYFGDQTTESTFQIVVTEASTAAFSGSQITNDFASDGAECQREHICQTDVDCITNLGWDYTCQDISLLKSNWPEFDSLANEIPNKSINVNLRAQFDQALGGSKRCVYRGKGALCSPTLQNLNKDDVHNNDISIGHQACTDNNYCQGFSLGSATKRFNNKIARFAASVNVQNSSSKVSESELDTFGLGVRSIGRPYAFNGGDSIPPEVSNNLSDNKAVALCIPGRDPDSSTMESSNFTVPGAEENGDKILNLGMTSNNPSTPTGDYFSFCGITDPDSGNRLLFDSQLITTATDSPQIKDIASTQAYSTNHLTIFEDILGEDMTTPMVNRQITQLTLGRNRCLRAPNSPCHTSSECAPNNYITNFTKRIAFGQSRLNDFELKFWQEDLVCSQAKSIEDVDYDHSLNRCCRETNKTVQIASFRSDYSGSKFYDNTSAPGTDIGLDSSERYSRNVVTYRETKSGSIPNLETPALQTCDGTPTSCVANTSPTAPVAGLAGTAPALANLRNQWKTFHLQSSRTCCSENWVRNFDSSNGGGHNWGPTKKQRIDKSNFQCYNWAATVQMSNEAGTTFFNCDNSDDPEDPDCPVRNLFASDYEPILGVMERLELTGIPQIMIELEEGPSSPTMCSAFPVDHALANLCNGNPSAFACNFDNRPPFMPGILKDEDDMTGDAIYDGVIPEYADTTNNKYYFSANDMDNFDPIIKKVFSEDTISCCLPLGTELNVGDDKNLCCSGFKDETGQVPRCALPDYTNLSVYFNRYVSSEAAGLDDSLFDEETGYFKSVDSVVELACQVNACASNTIAFGVAVTPLAVENHVGSQKLFPRFIDSNQLATDTEDSLAQLFEEGLRWNTQVYCFPLAEEGGSDNEDPRLTIKSCLQ